MKRPISAGDVCRVVGGLGRTKSPNLGLVVTVVNSTGDHSQLGRIWRCKGEGVQQLTDGGGYIVMGEADFAAVWLERIEPPADPSEATTTMRELEVL